MKSVQSFGISFTLIASGICIGYVLSLTLHRKSQEERQEVHMGPSASGLTNPLLECDLGREYLSKHSIRPFRERIKAKIDEMVRENRATTVSYYFRDLNNGSWFGFQEKEEFSPASLFKVPLLVFAFSQAAEDPELLKKRITYTGKGVSLSQHNQSNRAIEVGKDYSVRELIEYMILHSDNNATAILLEVLGSDKSKKVFHDLGIALLPSVDGAGRISVRDYATFFRVLYNASYLSQPASDEALLLLTKTEFNKGIVAGVPPHVPIAHKFGERGTDTIKQLHDCGIVYTKKSPYLLCIMTRGNDFSKLAETIAELSRTTYQAVQEQSH